MLLLEELDWTDKGLNLLQKLDVAVERGLDSLIFEKYEKLIENQALEHTLQSIQYASDQHLEEDKTLISYAAFLQEKYVKMQNNSVSAGKNLYRVRDENKRI